MASTTGPSGSSLETLIPKNGVLLNYAHQAMAPSKDYCQIMVTKTQLIFRVWTISLRSVAKLAPGVYRETHDEFIEDERCQSELYRVFGKHMVEYVKGLCQGHIDYLPRLPTPLLIRIIRFLPLQDIGSLAQCSTQFREICCSDNLWELVYRDHSETTPSDELRSLAEAIGWKKLFFTNKIQVQVQLSRMNILRQLESHDELSKETRRSFILLRSPSIPRSTETDG